MPTRIRHLGVRNDLPRDHAVVVKLAPGRFEVSGTAGTGAQACYLPATSFANQYDALSRAEDFVRDHRIKCIYVKGFTPRTQAR